MFDYFHQPSNSPYEQILAEIVGNVIISHHSDLKDFLSIERGKSTYLNRVVKKEIENYELMKANFFSEVMSEFEFKAYVKKATAELKGINIYKDLVLINKFIFSCLIDADRLNSASFDSNSEIETNNSNAELFEGYYEKLMEHLNYLKEKGEPSKINQLRSEMSKQCDDYASKQSGIYTLSIPTGGGKTLASLRYGLKHSLVHEKNRIIFILPYTTIIEQNADEVRRILEDESNILEHHSNVINDDEKDCEEVEDVLITEKERLRLAKDNWDSPIIFTTLVQFLNVFYAKGNRNTRRLHNMSNAVVVFDEVQKVPTKCIGLFNEAVSFLKNIAKTSVVLCTATQPTLNRVKEKLDIDGEIIKDIDKVTEMFKRVEVIDKTTNAHSTESLAIWIEENIANFKSTLVILNTKTVVRKLYNRLKESEIEVYHLSTSMCSKHRQDKLKVIREKLANNERIVCISTQLIEAGVDISFDCVIRSVAGLDSIAQAAGRCNRHGKESSRDVYVIQHNEENLSRLVEVKYGRESSEPLLAMFSKKPERYSHNLLSRRAMEEYFMNFYQRNETNISYPVESIHVNLYDLLMKSRQEEVISYNNANGLPYPLHLRAGFETVSKYFKVIEDNTTAIIVPHGEGIDLISILNQQLALGEITSTLNKLQLYSVQVYSQELHELDRVGALISHYDGMIYELKEGFYSDEFGLNIGGGERMADLIT